MFLEAVDQQADHRHAQNAAGPCQACSTCAQQAYGLDDLCLLLGHLLQHLVGGALRRFQLLDASLQLCHLLQCQFARIGGRRLAACAASSSSCSGLFFIRPLAALSTVGAA